METPFKVIISEGALVRRIVYTLDLLDAPARAFTKATALRWMQTERFDYMSLLSDLAELRTDAGCEATAYYLVNDLDTLISAAMDAIAGDHEVEIRLSTIDDRGYLNLDNDDRARIFANLLAFRNRRTINHDTGLLERTHSALDRITGQLVQLLDPAVRAGRAA